MPPHHRYNNNGNRGGAAGPSAAPPNGGTNTGVAGANEGARSWAANSASQVLALALGLLLLLRLMQILLPFTVPGLGLAGTRALLGGRHGSSSAVSSAYYFYNEITGQVQWEDPGFTPWEDERGMRYWLQPDGTKTYSDASAWRYTWIEQYNEDLKRAYFYNQETRESSWERPADLAWRRIGVEEDRR